VRQTLLLEQMTLKRLVHEIALQIAGMAPEYVNRGRSS